MDSATTTTETLTARCRETLAKMAHNREVLASEVPADVRRTLEERRLCHEVTAGYLRPTSRSQGYAHDPATFEA